MKSSKNVIGLLSIMLVCMIFAVSLSGLANSYTLKSTDGDTDDPWPSFCGDTSNSGLSPYSAEDNTGDVLWKNDFGGTEGGAAVGSDGTIYVGDDWGDLYAYNPDGSKKWKTHLSSADVKSTPAIDADGNIYVTTTDNNIYAISSDGNQKWKFSTNDLIRSSPVVADGTIYFGSYDHKLYALSTDGSKKWSYSSDGDVCASPAVSNDGTVYFGTLSGTFYALNSDGSEKWTFSDPDKISGGPAVDSNGDIYFGDWSGVLYALKSNGTKKWSFSTGDREIASSPAIGPNGNIYIGTSDGNLYSLDPTGSKNWWDHLTQFAVFSSPAVSSDGTIFVGTMGGDLCAYDTSGQKVWTKNLNHDVESSPAIGEDGTVYISNLNDGLSDYSQLYAIGKKATSAPPAPTAFECTAGDGSVSLTWDKVTDSGFISNYKVYRGKSGDEPTLLKNISSDKTSYTDGDVVNGNTYEYQVSAVNGVGEGEKTDKVSANPVADVLKPTSLEVKNGGDYVLLEWTAPNVDGVEGYKIYRGTGSGFEKFKEEIGVKEKYNDTDVDNGGIYYYYVTAIIDGEESEHSNEVSIEAGSEFELPSAPTNIEIIGNEDSLELQWDQPDNSGSSDLKYYLIYKKNGSEEWQSEPIDGVFANKTSYTDTNVESGVTYSYKVVAGNDEGNSDPSEVVSGDLGGGTSDDTLNEDESEDSPGFTLLLSIAVLSLVSLVYTVKYRRDR